MSSLRAELLFFAAVRALVLGFARLFWRLTVEGTEHVPEGPFVLAPVHRSNIDGPVVSAVTRRRVRYMMKQELWKYRLPARVWAALGGFPVQRRRADREALRRCLEVLRGGEPLVIFPEGSRRSGPLVESLHEGAAYLALRTGAPIVPVGIGGSERAMPRGSKVIKPGKVHIVVGPPLDSGPADPSGRASRRAVRDLTERLRKELQAVFDEAQAKAGAAGG